MAGLWAVAAAVGSVGAMWLWRWKPVRITPGRASCSCDVPLPLVLEMLSVAIRQGTSISRALIVVGEITSGDFGDGLRLVGERLDAGCSWDESWLTGDDDDVAHDLAVVRDAFAASWSNGSSPVNRLEAAIEQLDWDERARIEQSAAKLSVRLLLPTGLCMLPAFVAIGVIPAVMSFL